MTIHHMFEKAAHGTPARYSPRGHRVNHMIRISRTGRADVDKVGEMDVETPPKWSDTRLMAGSHVKFRKH